MFGGVEVRGKLLRVSSLLLPSGVWEYNIGHQVYWQGPLLVDTSHWSKRFIIINFYYLCSSCFLHSLSSSNQCEDYQKVPLSEDICICFQLLLTWFTTVAPCSLMTTDTLRYSSEMRGLNTRVFVGLHFLRILYNGGSRI